MQRDHTIAGGAARFCNLGKHLLWALLPLVACAVGPDHQPPLVAVTPQWRDATDPRIATQAPPENLWWESFADPVLTRLITIAQEQNLPLQVAGLRIVE